jgi:predicted permease
MFDVIVPVVVPVMVMAFVGFIWAKTGGPFDTVMVGRLCTAIGVPALIIFVLTTSKLDQNALLDIALAATLVHVVAFILGWLVLKACRISLSAYLPSAVLGNTGNLGLPLCLFAFGEQGLALAIPYFVVNIVLLFIIGPAVASGSYSAKAALQTPAIWAIVLAFIFIHFDVDFPKWVANSLKLLSDFVIPMMLLALGVSLAQLRITALGTAVFISIIRNIGGLAIGIAVAYALGLQGAAFGVVVIQSAAPVAIFNYLFAVRYNNNPQGVASIVMVSTLLSFAILPFIIGWVSPH